MCRFILTLAFFLLTFSSFSQSGTWEAEIILQSRHLWRGEKFGTDVSIEPSVTASIGNFSFNVWAAHTPDNSYSEIDLIPCWKFNYFALTILDYYNPVAGEKNEYLNFQDEDSRHSMELSMDNYSVEKQRLKWMVATFFLGDRNEETGKPFYSTYAEVKYPFNILGIDTEPFVGLTPLRGYYAEKFAVVNAGISLGKEIDFKLPFTLPLTLSFVSNPYTRNTFVTFAAGIAF